MTTTLKGGSLTGGSILGRKTLSSIGNQIFWYDYRSLVEIEDTDRVLRWGDLSANSIVLSKSLGGNPTTRPYVFVDGIGCNHTTDTIQLLPILSPNLTKFNIFHNGTPHAFYAVAKIKYISGALSQAGILQTYIADPNVGANFRLDVANRRMWRTFTNGSSQQSLASPSSSFTNDTWILFRFIHYGTGFSSNVKIASEANSYLRDQTLSLSGSNYNTIRFLYNYSAGGYELRVKLMTAYDLTGKNVSQINDFDTLFINTLKEDSEYSVLTTP